MHCPTIHVLRVHFGTLFASFIRCALLCVIINIFCVLLIEILYFLCSQIEYVLPLKLKVVKHIVGIVMTDNYCCECQLSIDDTIWIIDMCITKMLKIASYYVWCGLFCV